MVVGILIVDDDADTGEAMSELLAHQGFEVALATDGQRALEALRGAAKSPWVEVDLVRINPIGSHMDADPETVVSVIREMRAAGKGIVGMKILGQGDLRHKQDEALRYALGLGLLDAFTIGAESVSEQTDLMKRISAVT